MNGNDRSTPEQLFCKDKCVIYGAQFKDGKQHLLPLALLF